MEATLIEADRLKALHGLFLMDDARGKEAYDRIARLAKHVFATDVAAITFIDADRQWFKSTVGIDITENRRQDAFCDITINTRETTVIEDTRKDPRLSSNPFVTTAPSVRFYAGEPLLTDDGHAVGTICIFDTQPRELTIEERRVLKDLASMVMSQIKRDRDLAYVDPLTKLPNRLQFLYDLEEQLKSDDADLTVALVELMGLSESAEAVRAFGIGFFNQQMMQAASIVQNMLPNQVLYHVGAFHLGLFVKGSIEKTASTFENVALAMAEPFETSLGIPVTLRPCVGLRAVRKDDGLEIADVLRSLLSALKDARVGEQTLGIYDGKSDAAHQRSYRLLTDFVIALKDPFQLRMVFQPRVNLLSGKCESAEALLRWEHPLLGSISPAELFPIIEKTSLVRQTTEWVMESVIATIANWRRSGLSIKCSFNVSPRNIEEDDFVERLSSCLKRFGVSSHELEIEIVEDAQLASSDLIRNRLKDVTELGVSLAIDDFGSGYSNLSYLLSLPASHLKIDRSICKDINRSVQSATVAESVIDMAHKLGYRTVAEGVEDVEIKEMLQSFGCDEVQGFVFSPPLEKESFLKWIANHNSSIGN